MGQFRREAIEWWDKMDLIFKISLTRKYYPERIVASLTGREIEYMYNKEKRK